MTFFVNKVLSELRVYVIRLYFYLYLITLDYHFPVDLIDLCMKKRGDHGVLRGSTKTWVLQSIYIGNRPTTLTRPLPPYQLLKLFLISLVVAVKSSSFFPLPSLSCSSLKISLNNNFISGTEIRHLYRRHVPLISWELEFSTGRRSNYSLTPPTIWKKFVNYDVPETVYFILVWFCLSFKYRPKVFR